MLPEYFAVIGSVIASVGGIYYAYLTFKGRVQPNRVTWLFWSAFPLIAFAAQVSGGVGLVAWATFAAGAPPILVLAGSLFNKEAYWQTKRIDYWFAAAGFLSVIAWQATEIPNIAFTFALLADLLVALPTLLKAYRFPETESWISYGVSAFGFLVAMLAVQEWTYENYAFVAYLFLLNLIMAVLASRRPAAVVE
ncbi:MAG: hypothetical protein WCT99_11200 [Bacteroidota bacterium]